MDDVLRSVKKTFTDEAPSDSIEIIPPRAPDQLAKRAQDSIREQQARLASVQTRRRKLPPIPDALRKREPQPKVQRGFVSQRPRIMRADVPARVQVNAVAAQPEPASVQPLFRWGNRQARILEETARALTVTTPTGLQMVSPVQDHASDQTKLPKMSQKRPALEPAPRAVPTDADWNELKANLRDAVDNWVDKQRAAHESSQ